MVSRKPEKFSGPEYVGQWMSGPDAVMWIKFRSNEKVRHHDPETGEPLGGYAPGELAKARLYKLQNYEYESLTQIYDSESLIAQNFIEGVASMQDLLFEIDF